MRPVMLREDEVAFMSGFGGDQHFGSPALSLAGQRQTTALAAIELVPVFKDSWRLCRASLTGAVLQIGCRRACSLVLHALSQAAAGHSSADRCEMLPQFS